jgi:hypothetical protein
MPAHTAADINIEPIPKSECWTPRLAGPIIAAAVSRLGLMSLVIARNGVIALSQADTMSYLEPGRNLLLHGRFMADGVPDLVRTPGYPLFIAITSLAGVPAAAVANVILSVFTVVLVWKLGREVFHEERIALGAAWIFAFEPISITNSILLLSDTLFLFFLLLSMERLVVFLQGRRLRVLAIAGLWLAAATYVRPVTYYLPIALALGLFVALVRVPSLRWKAPAVLLISVLPWLSIWQIRNWVETGYTGFSSVREINLYYDSAADVTAHVEHRPFLAVRRELGYFDFNNYSGQFYLSQPYLALHPEQAGWSQGQRLAFMHSEAIRVISAHYGIYLRVCLTSLFRLLIDRGSGSIDSLMNPPDPAYLHGLLKDNGLAGGAIALAKAYPWVAVEKAAFAVALLGLYLFAARGVYCTTLGVFRGSMRSACLWLLLGTAFYFLAITAAGTGSIEVSRLRLPVVPVVCIFAAAGFLRKIVNDVPTSPTGGTVFSTSEIQPRHKGN